MRNISSYILFIGALTCAWPCTEPVFQYALNNWFPDPYNAVVFFRGTLTAGDSALIKEARDSATIKDYAVLNIHPFRCTDSMNTDMRRLWATVKSENLPLLALCYPGKSDSLTPLWSGSFTRGNLQRIISSPARREVGGRIVRGEAAVWILLSSGNNSGGAGKNVLFSLWDAVSSRNRRNRTEDDATFTTVSAALQKVHGEMKLDTNYVRAAGGDTVSLSPKFSCIRIARDDPAEKVFITMLLHNNPSLDTVHAPIAFPIFGEGRVFTALVGHKIQKETVEKVCRYIAGACACSIKAAYPGYDVLIVAPWYQRLIKNDDLFPRDSIVRTLSGMAVFAEITTGQSTTARESTGRKPLSSSAVTDTATTVRPRQVDAVSPVSDSAGKSDSIVVFHIGSGNESQQLADQAYTDSSRSRKPLNETFTVTETKAFPPLETGGVSSIPGAAKKNKSSTICPIDIKNNSPTTAARIPAVSSIAGVLFFPVWILIGILCTASVIGTLIFRSRRDKN